MIDEPAGERVDDEPVWRSDFRLYADGRNWAPLSELEAVTAELEMAQRHADEGWALYKDLQTRSQEWLTQANERAEAAEGEAARWQEGLHAEAKARLEAERKRESLLEAGADLANRVIALSRERDEAIAVRDTELGHCTELTATLQQAIARADQMQRERDAWGGQASTLLAERNAFKHQRMEAIEALAGLLDAIGRLPVASVGGVAAGIPLDTPMTRAEALVEVYRRSAPLAPPELVEAYRRVQDQMRQEAAEKERCPHGHAGCCGHHDLEDMPIHAAGDCASGAVSEEGGPP